MMRRWNEWMLSVLLLLSAALIPLSSSGAWFVLAPLSIAGCYLAGRRLPGLLQAVPAIFAGLLLALTALLLAGTVTWFSAAFNVLLPAVFFVVLPWWAGRFRLLLRTQREREQRFTATQIRLRERAQIAQEMHDQLGHDLALLALQAGALQVSVSEGSSAAQAAGAVRAQADEAIEHLQRIVAVLREGSGAPDYPTQRERISDLVARWRSKGIEIKCELVTELPATADPVVAATVHRILGEAVTNAVKYAPGMPLEMHLALDANPIRIEVSNPCTGNEAESPRPGAHGLAGLAERTAMLGGQFSAGFDGGHFRLTASLPRTGMGAPPASPTPPSLDLSRFKSHSRRRQWVTALVPSTVVLVLGAGFLMMQLATYRATAMSPAEFQQLQAGMSQAQAEQIITAPGLASAVPILLEPPRPENSQCRYYAARLGLLDFSNDMYRVCYREQNLISLDLLSTTQRVAA